MFGALGRADEAAPQRGIRWLLDDQETDGSWFGRWGVNHVYGTGAVVPALVAAGVARPPTSRSGAPCAGSSASRTTTAAGARTAAPTTTRRGSAAARAPPRRPRGRCWRCTPPASARRSARPPRRRLARRHAAPGRRLGRAVLHRHRLPVRLLHQLPPVPAGLPGDGARAMHGDERWPRRHRYRQRTCPEPRRGAGAGRSGELHRSPARWSAAETRRTCWRSTASPGWSTTSATRRRRPAGAARRRRGRARAHLRRARRATR